MVALPVERQYRHYLIIEDDLGRKEYPLLESIYTIGRKHSCTLHLHSQFVSRLHATLLRCMRNNGYYYYRILDGDGHQNTSANGILVNGKKVSAHELKNGDEIVFGPKVFAIYEYRPPTNNTLPNPPNAMEDEDPFDITLIDPAMLGEND